MTVKKILYIGMYMPYDSVRHAGGQVFNYYVKRMAGLADVKLLSFADKGEIEKSTLEGYGVDCTYIDLHGFSIVKKIFSINSKINPCHKYGDILLSCYARSIIQKLNQMKSAGYHPDTIVLQWTQMILLIKEVKEIYPDAKVVVVEEDVTFLRLKREYQQKKGIVKLYYKQVYENEKKRELLSVNMADLIFVYNEKDQSLLYDEKIPKNKVKTIVSYFHEVSQQRIYKGENHDILFYGHMGRPENYEAAIWFINNVLPLIKRPDVRFVVMGGSAKKIEPYASKNVIVTGYVDCIDKYFSQAALFVAPLTKGAGIKVKILEAMSSGIPVVTSVVGIEGIPAQNERDFLLYRTTEELVNNINRIFDDFEFGETIGRNGKELVKRHFNIEESSKKYVEQILNL